VSFCRSDNRLRRVEPRTWPGPACPRPPRVYLVELLVVIAIIAIWLVALAVSESGEGPRPVRQCQSNLRQLGLAWQLYIDDHDSDLPPNYVTQDVTRKASGLPGSWVTGMPGGLRDTNVEAGVLYAYQKATAIYRCPSDRSTVRDEGKVRARGLLDEPVHELRSDESTSTYWYHRQTDIKDPPPPAYSSWVNPRGQHRRQCLRVSVPAQ